MIGKKSNLDLVDENDKYLQSLVPNHPLKILKIIIEAYVIIHGIEIAQEKDVVKGLQVKNKGEDNR